MPFFYFVIGQEYAIRLIAIKHIHRITQEQVATVTYHSAFLFHISYTQADHLVFNYREVSIHMITKLTNLVLMTDLKLPSFVLKASCIDLRKSQTKDRRVTCTRFIENICRFTIEVSSVECQFIVPESCFNTDIGGTGLFPFQCRIDISGHCGSLCIHTSEYIVHRLSKCVSGLIRVVTNIIVTQDTV